MSAAVPRVAIVLPPREGFGPGRSGAIGLLVRRLAQTLGFYTIVIGGKQDGPTFPGTGFQTITPSLWSIGSTNLRYAAAVAEALKKQPPDLIEVHNRPEIALALAARLPAIPVVAFLHNDPFGMREASTPAERAQLLRRLAGVITPSDYLRRRVLDGVTAPDKDPVVLPNCLDLLELPAAQQRERLVLFAGRVVADKAPDAFVSACAAALPHLPSWRAEIIGADRFSHDSPDTGFVQMVRAAAEGANVRMLGYRDHPGVLSRDGPSGDCRGAKPVAGAVRAGGAGSPGEWCGADLLPARRPAGGCRRRRGLCQPGQSRRNRRRDPHARR